jgi:hypothetical protein
MKMKIYLLSACILINHFFLQAKPQDKILKPMIACVAVGFASSGLAMWYENHCQQPDKVTAPLKKGMEYAQNFFKKKHD